MTEVWTAKTFEAKGVTKLHTLKRLNPRVAGDEAFVWLFLEEARFSAQLTHPHIAQVADVGKVGDTYYLAEEYVSGVSLQSLFEAVPRLGEPPPIPWVCEVLSQCCEGLDYAHRRRDEQGRELNIVHRDMSPQNILVSYEGEAKLIGFATSRLNAQAAQMMGMPKRNFGYLSPEQVRGLPLERRSDVFALGVVLYEMLTGARLFDGGTDLIVLEKVRAAEVSPPSKYNPRVSPSLDRIVLKALAKDPQERYQSAGDLGAELRRLVTVGGSPFSKNDLQTYLKTTFAKELGEEEGRLEKYGRVQLPPGMAALTRAANRSREEGFLPGAPEEAGWVRLPGWGAKRDRG
jgi:serine/threonine protein kinase